MTETTSSKCPRCGRPTHQGQNRIKDNKLCQRCTSTILWNRKQALKYIVLSKKHLKKVPDKL